MKRITIYHGLWLLTLYVLGCFGLLKAQPCFDVGTPATATFATGGSGNYKNQILWLTWGTTQQSEVATYPHGKHLVRLENGATSRASIDKGNGRYLCIEATISDIGGQAVTNDSKTSGQLLNQGSEYGIVKNGWVINSYAPGNFHGDVLDDMYHIGGTDKANTLVSGIRNSRVGSTVSFKLTCKATLNGAPVRLAGLVLADAESMGATGEWASVTGSGKWTVIELKKNLSKKNGYFVRKTDSSDNKQTLRIGPGNDATTGAVAAMMFNETAYQGDEYIVSFNVEIKGGGGTAVALGLIPTSLDGGDAPESYGSPLHIIDDLHPTDDEVPTGTSVNLNTSAYKSGSLSAPSAGYLGSTYPDGDAGPNHSRDALGDDNTGNAINEEDAWPNELRRFSYKQHYTIGDEIIAMVDYKPEPGRSGFVYAWIDFDCNGKFDLDEMVRAAAPSDGTTVQLRWHVPPKRVIGSTYVRLRYVYDRSTPITDPAELEELAHSAIITNGEVEDHRIYILSPTITNPALPSKASPGSHGVNSR